MGRSGYEIVILNDYLLAPYKKSTHLISLKTTDCRGHESTSTCILTLQCIMVSKSGIPLGHFYFQNLNIFQFFNILTMNSPRTSTTI